MRKMRWVLAMMMTMWPLAACARTVIQGTPVPATLQKPPSAAPSDRPSQQPAWPKEAIQILEPGPGSRLTSPLTVAGMADATFEQTLIVRLVLDDGSLLVAQPITIASDAGQRGPFEERLPFNLSGERSALLQVLESSARDGSIIHLASVGVTLAADGEAQIQPAPPQSEQLVILSPEPNARVCGADVRVEGFGSASFEGTLVVEILDAEGQAVSMQPLIVQAHEMGSPGPFSIDLPCAVDHEQLGRIVVRDPLPAFDGLGHLNSIPVMLLP